MAGVQVGEQQRDGERFNALCKDGFERGFDFFWSERLHDLAGRSHPFINFKSKLAGNEWRRSMWLQVVKLRAGLASDLEQVPQAAGVDQSLRAPCVEHCIGRDGRPMDDFVRVRLHLSDSREDRKGSISGVDGRL